jgi:hypothetical protein
MTEPDGPRSIDLHLELESLDDLRLLRGALLAARGAELAEARRREFRHSAGYGSDSARDTMTAEAAQRRRRLELLDRLLAALDDGPGASDG